jgi:uncharacterized protein YbaP (TraB family)
MKQLITYVFLMTLFLGCKAQSQNQYKIQKDDNSLLWKISGNELSKPSFLFGTFHLLCRNDIHFSDQLKKAISNCDEIYMELDMDDPSTMFSAMMYMNMRDDTTLSDLYSPNDYDRLKNYFSDTLKMPLALLQKTKPYFLVALLYPRMMDCTSPAGVEEELLTLAKTDKKEVQGLETMQFQASVFDSIPYQWQAKELLKNIDSFSVNKKEFETMLGKSEFGSEKYDDLLLNNRNKRWVQKLDSVMKEKSVFVAVGAGHLVGQEGLISLFKKQGYTVEPLENK